jgi:hypothetical protein
MGDLAALVLEDHRAGQPKVALRPTGVGQGMSIELLLQPGQEEFTMDFALGLKADQVLEFLVIVSQGQFIV